MKNAMTFEELFHKIIEGDEDIFSGKMEKKEFLLWDRRELFVEEVETGYSRKGTIINMGELASFIPSDSMVLLAGRLKKDIHEGKSFFVIYSSRPRKSGTIWLEYSFSGESQEKFSDFLKRITKCIGNSNPEAKALL